MQGPHPAAPCLSLLWKWIIFLPRFQEKRQKQNKKPKRGGLWGRDGGGKGPLHLLAKNIKCAEYREGPKVEVLGWSQGRCLEEGLPPTFTLCPGRVLRVFKQITSKRLSYPHQEDTSYRKSSDRHPDSILLFFGRRSRPLTTHSRTLQSTEDISPCNQGKANTSLWWYRHTYIYIYIYECWWTDNYWYICKRSVHRRSARSTKKTWHRFKEQSILFHLHDSWQYRYIEIDR